MENEDIIGAVSLGVVFVITAFLIGMVVGHAISAQPITCEPTEVWALIHQDFDTRECLPVAEVIERGW